MSYNKEYIRENLIKNPYILKKMLLMSDIDIIVFPYLEHLCNIIKSKPNSLNVVKISYDKYSKVYDLYFAFLFLTKVDPVDISFSSLSLIDKENYPDYLIFKSLSNISKDNILVRKSILIKIQICQFFLCSLKFLYKIIGLIKN